MLMVELNLIKIVYGNPHLINALDRSVTHHFFKTNSKSPFI